MRLYNCKSKKKPLLVGFRDFNMVNFKNLYLSYLYSRQRGELWPDVVVGRAQQVNNQLDLVDL